MTAVKQAHYTQKEWLARSSPSSQKRGPAQQGSESEERFFLAEFSATLPFFTLKLKHISACIFLHQQLP